MFGLKRPRRLRALQVEVTSRCTRACHLCPRTSLAGRWRHGDLEDASWQRLVGDLGLVDHLHLQGWGEPLLDCRLASMVHQAHAAGCTVGITTNGDLLERAASWIVQEQVDQVAVSVAGDEPSHSSLRGGSCLPTLWSTISTLVRERRSQRRPKVQVSYLLTRTNASALPNIVRAAAQAGADELYVTHLDCTPSLELLELAAFTAEGLCSGVQFAVERAEDVARRSGLAFRRPALQSEQLLSCALDPRRFAFVGWDGRVGPCVNLLLPISGSIPRWTWQGSVAVPPMWYGRLEEASLAELLECEAYRVFTSPFRERFAANRRFWLAMGGNFGFGALQRLDIADQRLSRDLSASPFPTECRGCHKQRGW